MKSLYGECPNLDLQCSILQSAQFHMYSVKNAVTVHPGRQRVREMYLHKRKLLLYLRQSPVRISSVIHILTQACLCVLRVTEEISCSC